MEGVKFVLDTESVGSMSEERKLTILEAVELYLNNSYLFYTSIEINGICHYLGIPTGGAESSSLANITLRHLFTKYRITQDYNEQYYSFNSVFFRFLDDIFGNWIGTKEEFNKFTSHINTHVSVWSCIWSSEDPIWEDC